MSKVKAARGDTAKKEDMLVASEGMVKKYEQQYNIDLSGSREVWNVIDRAILEGANRKDLMYVIGRMARAKAMREGKIGPSATQGPGALAVEVAALIRERIPKNLPKEKKAPASEIARMPAKKPTEEGQARKKRSEIARGGETTAKAQSSGLNTKEMLDLANKVNDTIRAKYAEYEKKLDALGEKYNIAELDRLTKEKKEEYRKEVRKLGEETSKELNKLKGQRDRILLTVVHEGMGYDARVLYMVNATVCEGGSGLLGRTERNPKFTPDNLNQVEANCNNFEAYANEEILSKEAKESANALAMRDAAQKKATG